MEQIDLNVYKQSKMYFHLFDVLLKQQVINKDSFLENINITPSSYRRAKNNEQKVGYSIVEKLSKHFQLKEVSNQFIDELEKLANNVYFDMYYKIYDNYDGYLEKVEALLKEKYVLFPIIYLLKLFLIINSKNSVYKTIESNNLLYNELKEYKYFFNLQLLSIFELVHLSFEKKITNQLLAKNYNNELAYFILASKCCLENRYIESIYFANKSKDALLKELNFKRIIFLNLTIMNCYLYLENYIECYKLAHKQLLMLKSFMNTEFELSTTIKYSVVAALGLDKNEYVIDTLNNKKYLTMSEVCCLLIAKFKIDKRSYLEYFATEIDLENLGENDRNFLIALNEYLMDIDKKSLFHLKNMNIMQCIVNLIKSL